MTARSLATLATFLIAWSILTFSPIAPAFAQATDAQKGAARAFPKYPLWLARLLAPLGVAGAQALAGYQALGHDQCKAFNWLLGAAQRHVLFAEWNIKGYYYFENEYFENEEGNKAGNAEKEFLWHLHWLTHFPNDKDDSHVVASMLKLSAEQQAALRERFKTWSPADEHPLEPASCPSGK